MLQVHLQDNILPLYDPPAPNLSFFLEDITLATKKALKDFGNKVCTKCDNRLPSGCDILSIKTLHEKFTESFRAETPLYGCDCQDEDDFELLSSCGHSLLVTLPSLVIGVLQPSTYGLTLVDSTGSISCEVTSSYVQSI